VRPGQGFTLVEMMVVVGIVAILALMMLPSYHERNVREQVAESLALTEIVKLPIGVAWATTQQLPRNNDAAGLPPMDKIVSNYVRAVGVENGAIHVRFGNRAYSQIRDRVLTLRPAVVEDAPVVPVAWVCGFASVPDKMTVRGPNRTDVPVRYLPMRCR
jgi:type IV pilus assembly protein PilA